MKNLKHIISIAVLLFVFYGIFVSECRAGNFYFKVLSNGLIDTEFVSEFTYRPDMCLIQVATDTGLAIIDPKKFQDLSAFWEQLQL